MDSGVWRDALAECAVQRQTKYHVWRAVCDDLQRGDLELHRYHGGFRNHLLLCGECDQVGGRRAEFSGSEWEREVRFPRKSAVRSLAKELTADSRGRIVQPRQFKLGHQGEVSPSFHNPHANECCKTVIISGKRAPVKTFELFLVTIAGALPLSTGLVAQQKKSPPKNLALTPPMGWNSWNKFACNVNEDVIKSMADTMVKSGMKDAGYQYTNIDD